MNDNIMGGEGLNAFYIGFHGARERDVFSCWGYAFLPMGCRYGWGLEPRGL